MVGSKVTLCVAACEAAAAQATVNQPHMSPPQGIADQIANTSLHSIMLQAP